MKNWKEFGMNTTSLKKNRTDVIVVGGGAAGLLAAGVAANQGRSVLVLEKMERPAKKLLITGKGRCNVCNNCTRDEFMAAVRANPQFLYSAYSAFDAGEVMAFFEELGVRLKTERGGRVFPASDRAADIADALLRFANRAGVKTATGRVSKLLIADGAIQGVVTENGEQYAAESVLLATGGLSYPRTGSTGDGYALAESAGHKIIPTQPSLIPVVTEEQWCKEAMGLSLKNVILRVRQNGAKAPVYEELGEMLFTHFGVSGPLVLSASAHMRGELSAYKMEIDLKPGLTLAQLDARILRDFSENINKNFFNSLGALLPRKLIPIVVRLSGIDGEAKTHQITKEQRAGFAALIKGLPLTPREFRPVDEAVVTAGGVDVKDVNPKTMESKLTKGLFFAGELLDLDAYTGGYNLQIAFSTGYLAGQNV
jgi:predicted Rossmann fold flavoprotein